MCGIFPFLKEVLFALVIPFVPLLKGTRPFSNLPVRPVLSPYLFIAAAIVNTFMSAFKNNGAAKAAGIFFLLCQMLVLINAYNEMQDIMTNAINEMVDFLKIMLPAYMICVASTGYGMSAMIF